MNSILMSSFEKHQEPIPRISKVDKAVYLSHGEFITVPQSAMAKNSYFQSPEMKFGEGCDQRSDCYAFGVMLFFMMTRKFPPQEF